MFSPTAPRNFNELIPRLMGAINNRTPEDAAANLFNVTSPDERRDAIAYLQTKKWGHEAPYMRAYEILTTDPHPMVRAQAMRALGSSNQPAAADYLVKGLNDPDVQVRRDAANGLCTTWNDGAWVSLAAHVKDDVDEQVRIFSARALAHANNPQSANHAQVIKAIIDALSDKDAAVVRYAHSSLAAATGQDFGYDTKGWLSWYQQTYVAPPATQAMPATPPK
jgi:HEAT repeat protein